MRKSAAIIVICVVLAFMVSGCWDYREYEDTVQITGVGADYDIKTGKTTLILQYVSTTRTNQTSGTDPTVQQSANQAILVSTTADTLYEGLSKAQQAIPRKLDYSYLQLFVVGENAARYALPDIVELLDRSPAIRTTAYLVCTPGKAQDLLRTIDAPDVNTASRKVNELLQASKLTGAAIPVTIQGFLERLAISGWEATTPCITTTARSQDRLPAATGADITFDEKSSGYVWAGGSAAFRQGKLAGWLNEKETRGLGWITGQGITPYTVSVNQEGLKDALYYRVTRSGSKMRVKLMGNQPVINLKIKVTADLREYYTSSKGSMNLGPDTVRLIQKKAAQSINSDIQACLIKGQHQLKSDIFGFGFAFFREYPGLWHSQYEKVWPALFPDIPVNTKVELKIINTGTVNKKLIIK